MSSPSKSGSDRPSDAGSTAEHHSAESGVEAENARKNSLILTTDDKTDTSSQPSEKKPVEADKTTGEIRDSKRNTPLYNTPLPGADRNKSERPHSTESVNKTIPLSPELVKNEKDAAKTIGVPIRRISDKPLTVHQSKGDFQKPATEQEQRPSNKPSAKPQVAQEKTKTVGIPIKHVSDNPKSSQPAGNATAHASSKPNAASVDADQRGAIPKGDAEKTAALDAEDKFGPAREPLRRVKMPAVSSGPTVSVRPVSLIKGKETSQVAVEDLPTLRLTPTPKPVSSRPSPSTTASVVVKQESEKPHQVTPPTAQRSEKKKTQKVENKRREAIKREPSVLLEEVEKAVRESKVPIYRWWPAISGATWLIIGVVSFAVIAGAYKWTKKPTLDAPANIPAKDLASLQQPDPIVTGPMTEIVTEPEGAEVVFQGSVIGKTPTKVQRSLYEQLILLRKTGYEPKLVRLSLSSQDVIRVELEPTRQVQSEPPAQTVSEDTKDTKETRRKKKRAR